MTGVLHIVDESGERTVELSRTGTTIGSDSSDSIVIKGEDLGPALVTLNWSSRRATWVLYCPLPLAAPVIVNRRAATPGEQIPLANFDVIELPGAFLKFQRLLARPSRGGRPLDRIPLHNKPLAIGRSDPQGTADAGRIDLDSEETTISRVHALVEPEGQDYVITDHSRRGMELNGVAFTRERLVFGDRLRISDYIFEFTGDAIQLIHPESSGSVSARNLTVVAGGRTILDQFSVNITAGQFIGVLGGSGQGKSTLLNALCGVNPPTSGEVRIGGVSLFDRAGLREIGIGFVPQDDIVHKELTVTDAISFSARLRLCLPRHQIDALVLRVITRLGLAAYARQRIADLSGGQRKRVSIAIELLAKPSVLFLDEPSSGLDPAAEEALMTLLQSLTLSKLTVVCTTHVLQKAYLFDRVLFIKDGKLVFAGHTDEARRHFLFQSGMEDHASLQHSPIERIHALLANSPKPAKEWELEFRRSAFASRAVPPLPQRQPTEIDSGSSTKLKVSPLSTFLLLATRQWKIFRSNFWNLVFIAAQPVLIGFLIGWVADKSPLRMFLCVVATMWFGCSNGAQQIVSELLIFRRERVSGQGLNAYVLSKFGFLSLVSLAQAAVLLIVTLFCSQIIFHPEKIDSQNLEKMLMITLGLRCLAITAAAITGVSIGLMISSLVSNTTQAVLWVPLILIPQILFGGIVVPVADMSRSVRILSHVMPGFAAQRIMDVASLYGLTTPFLTNRTKIPLFLTSRGDQETVEWEDNGQSFSQSYDKLSPVNTSWQNMAIIPERLGQHKQVGERSENGSRIEYRDTVESRRDVRYSKGTVFRSLADFYSSLLLLSIWVGACYLVIVFGLQRKQTGK